MVVVVVEQVVATHHKPEVRAVELDGIILPAIILVLQQHKQIVAEVLVMEIKVVTFQPTVELAVVVPALQAEIRQVMAAQRVSEEQECFSLSLHMQDHLLDGLPVVVVVQYLIHRLLTVVEMVVEAEALV